MAASRACIVLMALGDLETRDFELLAWLRILLRMAAWMSVLRNMLASKMVCRALF